MSATLICLLALGLLIVGAYRGFSVILLAPAAAMLAVLLTIPEAVPLAFSELFMARMVGFLKNYFPLFLLGAVFGKLIELAGLSTSLVSAIMRLVGRSRAMLAVVLACASLTYGGVSLFVVIFAAYPIAGELFRLNDIPKRLLPATVALGAFTFTMDSLPGTPQIQNLIPTMFFGTTAWAAPGLGMVGGLFIGVAGLLYLGRARRRAELKGEGYGRGHVNEPIRVETGKRRPWPVAVLPLLTVAVGNFAIGRWLPMNMPPVVTAHLPGLETPLSADLASVLALWSVEAALLGGIAVTMLIGWREIVPGLALRSREAVAGALLASMNTASEYGFGAVIAALPGFVAIRQALMTIPHPLVNEAVTVSALAGVTGSASSGLSIALGAMADTFRTAAAARGIPPEVLHRVASMASGGLDTLPHNGAVITLVAVAGLSHRQAYRPIFAITCIKTVAVGVVILTYALTGLV